MAHNKILSVKALAVIAFLVTHALTYQVKGKLPDLDTIVDFLQKIVKPYVNSTVKTDIPTFRTHKHSSIEKFINRKIEELKPYLQDYENDSIENVNNNNITLDGDDETTIIEFLPPANKKKTLKNYKLTRQDPLKSDIEKYKKMRQKIKTALLKESVSEKTRHMVTKTLDKMIAELIGNQCSWKSRSNGTMPRNGNGIEKSAVIARRWNQQWSQLKKQYIRSAGSNKIDAKFPGMKLYQFFEQFHDFLSHIVDDTEKISDRYKIVCQFIERNGDSAAGALRKGDPMKGNCGNFKLCSGELKFFLLFFYNTLNNTAVSTLRNYASMYVRDVNTDTSNEKNAVVMTVNEIGDLVEQKVVEMFKKETSVLQLDKKNGKDDNLKALKHYVYKVVDNTVTYIKSDLAQNLRPLKSKLQLSISQDLNVNLDLDLGNLKKVVKGSICEKFTTCNGKYIERRSSNNLMLGDYNKNSVYVKVQMNLDTEIKDKLVARLGTTTESDKVKTKTSKHGKGKKNKSKKHKGSKPESFTMQLIDANRRNLEDISVSRTTHQISTNGGTKPQPQRSNHPLKTIKDLKNTDTPMTNASSAITYSTTEMHTSKGNFLNKTQ
ncbi:hypothetical protein evm_005460 [Chilo suppressalis]|nr:hypothetical protein evm_005460 [Chilo suppressalis]